MTKIWHALQKVLPMQGGYRWVAFIREGRGGSPPFLTLHHNRLKGRALQAVMNSFFLNKDYE